MKRLGEWVFDHSWRVLLGAVLLGIAAVPSAAQVFDVAKQGGFEDPSSEASQVDEYLAEHRLGTAGFDDLVLLVRSEDKRVASPSVAIEVGRLVSVAVADPMVSRVFHRQSEVASGTNDLDSADQMATVIAINMLGTDDEKRTYYRDVLEPLLRSEKFEVQHGGLIPGNLELTETVVTDLRRAELIALPVTLIALWLLFGGVVASLLPVIIAGVALALAWGATGVLGRYVDMSVLSLTPMSMLALGISVDYSLFVVLRYREEMARHGDDVRTAVGLTSATAGRAVLLSGVTTAISLASLLMFNEMFLRSVAIGTFLSVVSGVLVATTVLPALIAILGRAARSESHPQGWLAVPYGVLRFAGRRFDDFARPQRVQADRGFWFRMSRIGARWPLPLVTVVVLVLLLAGIPFLRINLTLPDERNFPSRFEASEVSAQLRSDFPNLDTERVDVLFEFESGTARERYKDIAAFVAAVEAIPGVESVDSFTQRNTEREVNWQELPPDEREDITTESVEVAVDHFTEAHATYLNISIEPPELSSEARDIVNQLRALPTPDDVTVRFGGGTAALIDGRASLAGRMPYVVLYIIAVTLIALFVEFRSILIPLKAVLLNAISISAALGALVWVFQDGHLEQFLRFEQTGAITTVVPVLIFAIVFGLSMDYEIFMLSRIREEYRENGGDTELAVARGLQRTGRMITGAALLIVLVIGAFATSEIVIMKQIGFGLGLAILLDATVVRAFLVPASMQLMGNANWWAPRWLARRGREEREVMPAGD